MANDDDTKDFAQYLNDHPDEAGKLQVALRSFIQQYEIADSLMVSVSKQLADVRQMAYEPIKSTYIPTELFTKLAQQLDTILPANWPRPIPSTERMEEVLENDGIPIVHIPRAEIVQAIVDADDYDARIEIIGKRADDIAVDCSTALTAQFDEGLEKQIPLVRRAIEAHQARHFEAAQALAVSVCDTYLKMMFPPEPTPKKKLRRIGYAEMAESSLSAHPRMPLPHGFSIWAMRLHLRCNSSLTGDRRTVRNRQAVCPGTSPYTLRVPTT